MNARRLFFSTALMMSVLAVLAAACSSSGDAAQDSGVPATHTLAGPVSLEEYFERVDQMADAFAKDSDAVVGQLEDVDPNDEEAALRSAQEVLPELVAAMDSYLSGLREIAPPQEAQDAHAEYAASLQEVRDAFAEAFDTKLASASSYLELLDVLLAPEIEAAVSRFDEACSQLTSVATSGGITAELSCAFLEGEEDETPEETADPTEVPLLESDGPELSAEDYFRRVEAIVAAADVTGMESLSPESDSEAREQMVQIIDLSISAYAGMREELLELNPPEPLRPAHARFVAAVEGQHEYFEGFDGLTVESSEQLWQVFAAGLVFGDAIGVYAEACRGIEDVAEQSAIMVELDCPFD